MNDTERSVFWICVILTMAMAFTAMMIALPRVFNIHSNINFDYQAMIVTILGIFITALIGWQIWATINVNRVIDRLDTRVRDMENTLHINIGEICSDISSTQPNGNEMAHVRLLFAIHALVHYSQLEEFERCEREIDALIDDSRVIANNAEGLRAMFHRMTGRIAHPERIRNFSVLINYINNLFSQPTPPEPSN